MARRPHQNNPDHNLLGGLNGMISVIVVVIICALLFLAFGAHLRGCSAKRGKVYELPADATRFSTALVDSNGIHVATGLIYAPGIEAVQRQCMGCHSPMLISQFSATREGWADVIRWMQETQGLWDLGADERKVLDYLASHYAPVESGRRAHLDIGAIEWYELAE